MAVLRTLLGLLCVAKLCTSQCDGVKEFDARRPGEISSPSDGGGKYSSNLNCVYKINAPDGYRIKITFLELDIAPSTSCISDRLEIHGKDGESVIGVFCGNQTPRPVLSHEEDNELRIIFTTEAETKAGKGFRIRYESSPDLELCSGNKGECKNRNCFDINKICDGVDDCGDGTDEEGCSYTAAAVECGKTPINPDTIYGSPDRMVGGETAKENSWPWHASIQRRIVEPNGHFCAGTLISAQWVLTAARCFLDAPFPKSIRVTLGSHRLFGKTEYEQVRVAEKIISYPDLEGEDLKDASLDDDLALVKLNAPVKFNDGVRPACLPYEHWKTQAGWKCYTTGWGETKGAGFSDELKQSLFEIKSIDHCEHNDDKEICVEFPQSAPCQDDTGSPLVCRLAGQWYLLGSTSRPAQENPKTGLCSALESKILFTRVAHKADWIRDTINENSEVSDEEQE